MKIIATLVSFLTLSTNFAMDQKIIPIIMSTAKTEHAEQIVDLINTQAVKDNDKIVVLPQHFRKEATEDAIINEQLYRASVKATKELIALAKLYVITQQEKYNDITLNEIRCANKNNFVDAQKFTCELNFVPHTTSLLSEKITPYNANALPTFSFENSAVIYLGGEFTAPKYRGNGINSKLRNFAFNALTNKVMEQITVSNLCNLVLFYGLTEENSGETLYGINRTPSIIRTFIPFAQKIQTACAQKPAHNSTLYHIRYRAFMPTFNLEDTTCKPLPDDQSIPGYGNVLIFPLVP